MDNYTVNIVSDGDLRPHLELLFQAKKVTGYRVEKLVGKRARLILYWSGVDDEDYYPLPAAMPIGETTPMIMRWLESLAYWQSTNEPDHDGDNGHGWRLCYGDLGYADYDFRAFCAIEPEWAMYGK